MTVAIVTDSGSDLTPAQLREGDIRQVPLTISFGDRSYLSPDELAPEDFWIQLLAPGSPFPHTAAPSAGQFKQAFEEAFAEGADGIVCVCMGEKLSSTLGSAQIAREMLPASRSRSSTRGPPAWPSDCWPSAGYDGGPRGFNGPDRRATEAPARWHGSLRGSRNARVPSQGRRIGHAKAAIGGLLSVKPIITVADGLVVTADQPRTRAKARERLLELMTDRPATELFILFSPPADGRPSRRGPCASPGTTTQSRGDADHWAGHWRPHRPGAYGGILVHEE